MSKVLENLIDEITTLHDQYRFEEDGLGGYLLFFNGAAPINIFIDHLSGQTHLLASVGRLSADHATSLSPSDQDQQPAREWFEFTIDDHPSALRMHHALGRVLLDSWANIAELNLVTFGNWIQKFISKLEEWSRIFSSDIYQESPMASHIFTNIRFI